MAHIMLKIVCTRSASDTPPAWLIRYLARSSLGTNIASHSKLLVDHCDARVLSRFSHIVQALLDDIVASHMYTFPQTIFVTIFEH